MSERQGQLLVERQRRHAISPDLISLFLETEINFGGEGGLYAECIRNRDFETLGRGNLGEGWAETVADIKRKHDAGVRAGRRLDPQEPAANQTDYRPWRAFGGARAVIDNSSAPFPNNPHALLLAGSHGAGVANPGYWGIGVRPGVGYRLSMWAIARGAPMARLGVQLVEGSRVLCNATFTLTRWWERHEAFLRPAIPTFAAAATLEVVLLQQGAVLLDHVSLMPDDAAGGIFRADVFGALAALRPGFVRFPGGNYLEGHGPRTHWDWKATVAAPAHGRKGHYNSAWKYWVSDALGLFELLLLAELLRTAPQVSVFTGYHLDARGYPEGRSGERLGVRCAQDALDLIQFANGPTSSVWGTRRAALGHPEPFQLRRLEIGNEERDLSSQGYAAHYRTITQAIWRKHPEMYVVACGFWDDKVGMVGNPCLAGQRCDAWDEHYYRSTSQLLRMASLYDSYNRSLPKVYVGEYAAKDTFDHEYGHLQRGLKRRPRLTHASASGFQHPPTTRPRTATHHPPAPAQPPTTCSRTATHHPLPHSHPPPAPTSPLTTLPHHPSRCRIVTLHQTSSRHAPLTECRLGRLRPLRALTSLSCGAGTPSQAEPQAAFSACGRCGGHVPHRS